MSANLSHLYILNIAASWGLVVLIWVVQIIVYPGFRHIASEDFPNYHHWYVIRISAIVLPLMGGEVILAIGWLWLAHYSVFSLISAGWVGVVWLSTFGLQVPIHNRLQTGKDDVHIKRLVTTNWIRTIAWSLKAVVVTIAAVQSFS